MPPLQSSQKAVRISDENGDDCQTVNPPVGVAFCSTARRIKQKDCESLVALVNAARTAGGEVERTDLLGASVEQDTSCAEANVPWRHRWRVERPETWNELPWSSAS